MLYPGLLAGVRLCNESILQELGFGAATFRDAMGGLMVAGNLATAWAARRFSLSPVMAGCYFSHAMVTPAPW